MGSNDEEGLPAPNGPLRPSRTPIRDTFILGHETPSSGPSDNREDRPIHSEPPTPTAQAEDATINSDHPTHRQLRHAIRIAMSNGIKARSGLDAIHQLRKLGINPFLASSQAGNIRSTEEHGHSATSGAPSRNKENILRRIPGDNVQLLKRSKRAVSPPNEQPNEVSHVAEIQRIHGDLEQLRQRRLRTLFMKMFAFVLVPTAFACYYFYVLATPMYSVRSEFIILQSISKASNTPWSGLFSGSALATSPDSIAVQGYLTSREAMERLDNSNGFRLHFQSPNIDFVQRLATDATLEAAYRFYKKHVLVAFDEVDQVIRLEVIAADPEVAKEWSLQLINYAEGQVNQLTKRLRDDQMRDAQASYDAAHKDLISAELYLTGLQKKFKVISSEAEIEQIVAQIKALEAQISDDRLAVAQLEANVEPSVRVKPIKRRIATLEEEVAALRSRLTSGSQDASSMAEIQGELLVAQAGLQTRQILVAKTLQALEAARVSANRQARYLSVSVSPIAPDQPSYPRPIISTIMSMLFFLGVYLAVSFAGILFRENASS